jgi:hypothetical protein
MRVRDFKKHSYSGRVPPTPRNFFQKSNTPECTRVLQTHPLPSKVVGITLVVAVGVEATDGRSILDHNEGPAILALLDVAEETHEVGDIEAARVQLA